MDFLSTCLRRISALQTQPPTLKTARNVLDRALRYAGSLRLTILRQLLSGQSALWRLGFAILSYAGNAALYLEHCLTRPSGDTQRADFGSAAICVGVTAQVPAARLQPGSDAPTQLTTQTCAGREFPFGTHPSSRFLKINPQTSRRAHWR